MGKNQMTNSRWVFRFQKIQKILKFFVGAKTLAKNSYF